MATPTGPPSHPSFPSGPLLSPRLLLHVFHPLILISHSANNRFSALFSGPFPWQEQEQAIFLHSFSITVPILFSPLAETVSRSSVSVNVVQWELYIHGSKLDVEVVGANPLTCAQKSSCFGCLNILAGCISGASQGNRTGTYSAASSWQRRVTPKDSNSSSRAGCYLLKQCPGNALCRFLLTWGNKPQKAYKKSKEAKPCSHHWSIIKIFCFTWTCTQILIFVAIRSQTSIFMRLHVSSLDYYDISTCWKLNCCPTAKMLPASVQEASARAAFWLMLASWRRVEALIKHARQHQTLDLCTSEGRWLQKQQNKHIHLTVFGPLSSNAEGLMSKSAASQILLHFITYVGGSLLLGTTCFFPISHSCLITLSFLSLFPLSCLHHHWAVINIVIFN